MKRKSGETFLENKETFDYQNENKFGENEMEVLCEQNQITNEPQKKKSKSNIFEEGLSTIDEAESGILEKIVLSNFMCHKKLEVSFGTNVNFVIGRNGSGKSAILTGIMVGLGGKANITNRGSSLKGFIKEGCSACSTVVTLRNRGTDAFKPDQYGSSIIIERKITADGSSSYKIKNKQNQVISTKKEELMAILDQFNIQIDNPVAILTQDTSRSFLNTSNEKDKYTFFLKATQLEQMTSDYQEIQQEKEILKETLKRKREVIPELHNQVKLYEEKYKDLQQLKDMEQKVQELKNELAWAIVRDKQIEVSDIEQELLRYQVKVPNYKTHLTDTEAKLEASQKSLEKHQKEIILYAEEVNVILNEKTHLEKNQREIRNVFKQAQNACKEIESQIKQVMVDKESLIKEIETIRNAAKRDVEFEQRQREVLLSEKKRSVQQLQLQLNTTNQQMQQMSMEIRKRQESKNKLLNDIRDTKKLVDNKRNKLQSLESNQKDRLSVFGKSTAAILDGINEAMRHGRFQKKPVGPLGSLVKIKDYAWVLAVEKCIGQAMPSYACDNGQDMIVLKQIFNQKCGRDKHPSIIVSPFSDGIYDTSRNRPNPSTYPSVMDLLEFENSVVANTFIDQCGIESIILIADPKEARDVIWNNKICNVNKALSIAGAEIIGGRMSKFYPNSRKHATYFQTDIAQLMRDAELELLSAQQSLKTLNDQVQMCTNEMQKDQIELDKMRRKVQQEQDQLNNTAMEIQEIEAVEVEKIPDAAELVNDLTECDNSLVVFRQNLNEAKEIFEEKSLAYSNHNELMKKNSEQCQAATLKLEAHQNDVNNCETEILHLASNKKYYENKYKELMTVIDELLVRHNSLKSEFETAQQQALQYCEEIKSKRKVESLESEIIRFQRRIQHEETNRGSAREITEKYQNALTTYNNTKNLIEQHINFRKLIEKALKRRSERFFKFQKYITDRARYNFLMLLSQRGYSGKLTLNHEEKTLIIQVNVENAAGASTNDSKSLSGGERSFSTICFIMALWEAMEAPFRCLDEFDVFMDMLNRRISMNMLLKLAKETPERQFILLTPQDMSNVTSSHNVRIFKLQNPDRGQLTIPFEPEPM
ncbi:structural maintenance of chromosomes protein 6 isoform X2 [Hydra vulgaris]|uniref:Structural maintenance of chromosomes protein 6 isoform X2 n=1 Tax=Hydra vulgaris TaxID=6087 RepID=A0ABM4BI79_HYDVU